MKRFVYGLLLVCMVLGLAAPAWAAPQVVLTARAANEGRVRPGGWVTITVDLSNQGRELIGELVVEAKEGPWENRPQYVVPLSLPSGGTKRVPVTIPLQGVGTVHVRFESGGALVADSTVNLTTIQPDALLIGVLSDDELGVPALARLGQGGKGFNAQVVRMEAQTFPARASQLADFDVLALSRFDTATLSKEQLLALEAWVGRGGVLLLAGGPEWKRTFAPLPPALLPVSVTGTADADLTPLADLVGKPITGQAPVSVAEVLRGQVIARAGEIPLLSTTQVGTGRVIYLAADPSLQPMVAWQGQTDLFDRYLGVTPKWGKFEFRNTDHYIQDALRRIPGLGLPSVILVAALLGGYLLLVGPVNYLILKRMDRREWAWLTVPILSLSFVGAVYGTAFGTRSTQMTHLITMTELAPGTQTAIMTSYVGVYAPSKTRLDIPVEGAKLVKPLFAWGGGDGSGGTTRIVTGERTTVQLLGLNNYSLRGFAMEQDIATRGGLELIDVKLEPNGLMTGRLVNRLDRDLHHVAIVTGQEPLKLGTLAAGATSEPIRIDLALMNPGRGGWGWGWNGADPDETRRNILLNSFFETNSLRGGGGLSVVGFTETPLLEPELTDMGRLYQGTNMLYATLPIPVDVSEGNLPPGIVQGIPTDRNNLGNTPMGYILNQGSADFSLNLPAFDRAKVAEVNLHLTNYGGGGYTMQVMNYRTGQWVKLDSMPVQVLPAWQDFISEAGLMQVRIETTMHLEMSPPTISMKGVAR